MSWKSLPMQAIVLAVSIGCCRVAIAEVTVLDPWVRGTVEGQTSTAAYMTLRSDTGARLVSATSPVAARCSVHEMKMDGNLMRMRMLDFLPVPPGGATDLKEGGSHLMLEGLTRPLKEGDTVRLALTFVDAAGKRQAVDVQAPVVPLGASRSGAPHRAIPMTR
jgi:hypothetical protein